MKEKGQQNRVAKPELLAFARSFGEVPERFNGPVCKTVQGALITLAGSNPALSARLSSPVRSANYLRGLASGFRPKQGLITHCHCDAGLKKDQGPNDLPQLQDRMQT